MQTRSAQTLLVNLDDIVAHRMTIFGRLLAGQGIAFPLETIEAFARLKPELIRDERARRFLLVLAARRAELEATSEPAGLALEIALGLEVFVDLLCWLIDSALNSAEPERLARELARMAIASGVVETVQAELAGGVDFLDAKILLGLEAIA